MGDAVMAVDAVCGVCAESGFVEDSTGGRTEPLCAKASAVVVCVPAELAEPGLVTIEGGLMALVFCVRDAGLAMSEGDEALLVPLRADFASPNRLAGWRGEECKEGVEFVRMVEKFEGRAI